MGRRALGTSPRVTKPTRMRAKVSPFGATERSPSAMKRNDAPQMRPGPRSSSQSAIPRVGVRIGLGEHGRHGRRRDVERGAQGRGNHEVAVSSRVVASRSAAAEAENTE